MTPHHWDIVIKLLVATVLGGIIGFEREAHKKEAGFRTYALVCLGSALFMIVSLEMFEVYKSQTSIDPGRIAAQVVTGIGFLGAGAIIRSPQGIRGLTSAAGIWAAAGIGLACGMGYYWPAVVTTVLTLIILIGFSKIEHLVSGKKKD